MKVHKKQFALGGMIGIATLCLIAFCYTCIQQGKTNIHLNMKHVLQESINQDYNKRFYSNIKSIPYSLGRKIKSANIESEKGIETITFKDSIDELVADQLLNQYLFAQFDPIIPNDLNAIFNKEMAKYDIYDKTGIIYRCKGKAQYSDNDSASLHSALCTHIIMLDVKNTISVQAWVDYSMETLLQHINLKMILIGVGFYILLLFIIILLNSKKKQLAIVVEANENCLQLRDIRLELDKKRLYFNNTEYPISNLDFELLQLFIQSPNQFLTRKEIGEKFWPKENNPRDKINTHISILRKALKDFPAYGIEADKGIGYQLIVPNDGK